MNKNELIEFSDLMFKNINYYVIQHGFELEVYNNLNYLQFFYGDGLDIMTNFISYIFDKVITHITIRSFDKTIKVFVRDKKELIK